MADRHLTLIQLNDTHAYLEPHPEVFWGPDGPVFRNAGGYARIAGLVGKIRRESGGRCLLLDCGDTLHGTAPAVKTRGEALVPVLNALGIAAMTGHWDFAYGPGKLREIASRLEYPILALNCYELSTGRRPFAPSVLVENRDVSIGVVGIAATILDKTMPPSFATGLRFTEGVEELPGECNALRGAGADIVVVISHLGLPQDLRLAARVQGIDVLLSGHTHHRLEAPISVNDTLVIQSGVHGSFVGRLDLVIGQHGIVHHTHTLYEVDDRVSPDQQVRELVERAIAPFRDELREVVGRTEVPLYRGMMFESSMDVLLLDAVQQAGEAELSFSNGWRYGAPILPGVVTRNDLFNMVPMNPEVMTISLSGSEVLAMLEENLERTFACDPFAQMGGYVKRCLGLTCYVKLENPPGHRIQACWAGGERIIPDRAYRTAFVTVQGVPEHYGRERSGTGVSVHDAIEERLAKPWKGQSGDASAFRVI
jgi:2',3'-cyclic-nucleotide 2'-phosphodiesterase (5'-nucleotidase family)